MKKTKLSWPLLLLFAILFFVIRPVDAACITDHDCSDKLASCYKSSCSIIDLDADSIPDRIDMCKGSSYYDYVDTRQVVGGSNNPKAGCSCPAPGSDPNAISADIVVIKKYQDNSFVDTNVNCKDIDSFFTEECNDNSLPSYCCNGKIDNLNPFDISKNELLADCGANVGCKPCKGMCTKIVDSSSKLGVLFVPVKYVSGQTGFFNTFNRQPTITEWYSRAALEAYKLSTTPPFCSGKETCNAMLDGDILRGETNFAPNINIWRLDNFGLGERFIDTFKHANKNIVPSAEEKKMFDAIKSFCPGIEEVTFINSENPQEHTHFLIPSTYDPKGEAIRGGGYSLIWNNDPQENVISHEIGHSLCGLDDEYKVFGHSSAEVIDFVKDSINCVSTPEFIDRNTGQKIVDNSGKPVTKTNDPNAYAICKWDSRHSKHDEYMVLWGTTGSPLDLSDAGCIPGCQGEESLYMSANDFPVSMMNKNMVIGPGEKGLGSWNKVGYARCKQIIDKYK